MLVLGKIPTQGLEHTLTAKKCIQLILLLQKRNFAYACILMEQLAIHLLMVQKVINLGQMTLK